MKRGISLVYFFLFVFVLFYSLSMILPFVLMKENEEEVGTKSKKRHKKTNSRQLRMSDYCKMTN